MSLSNKEKELYDYIVSYKEQYQRDPLYKEIIVDLNITGGMGYVSRLIKRLEKKKVIKRGIFIVNNE